LNDEVTQTIQGFRKGDKVLKKNAHKLQRKKYVFILDGLNENKIGKLGHVVIGPEKSEV
jgi:hypothetical protein